MLLCAASLPCLPVSSSVAALSAAVQSLPLSAVYPLACLLLLACCSLDDTPADNLFNRRRRRFRTAISAQRVFGFFLFTTSSPSRQNSFFARLVSSTYFVFGLASAFRYQCRRRCSKDSFCYEERRGDGWKGIRSGREKTAGNATADGVSRRENVGFWSQPHTRLGGFVVKDFPRCEETTRM